MYYRRGVFRFIWFFLKKSFYKFFVIHNRAVFLNPSDLISIGPLIKGFHEPQIVELIDSYVGEYGDMFIDIGANVGLTSAYVGKRFKKVICYEPNPLCVKILEVNLELALSSSQYVIYPCALGKTAGEFILNIPKRNWGGAFIDSNENSYSKETLLAKDRFEAFDKHNYSTYNVPVKSARDELRQVFQDFDCRKFILKIDVEGFEKVVISEIYTQIPANSSCMIIFENWSQDIDALDFIAEMNRHNKTVYKFQRRMDCSSVEKILRLAIGQVDGYSLAEEYSDVVGDFVIFLEPLD